MRLQALIGLSRTLDMVLTGRSLTPEEAFQWGLANRLVPCGTGQYKRATDLINLQIY